MLAFEVNDMTCGHCVATITEAVKALDPDGRVRVAKTPSTPPDFATAVEHGLARLVAEHGATIHAHAPG